MSNVSSLTLTRKEHEQILIDGKTLVTIKRIKGGTVSVGIQAPRDIPVIRMESIQKHRPENPAA